MFYRIMVTYLVQRAVFRRCLIN